MSLMSVSQSSLTSLVYNNYLRQGECSEHWWRLSNCFICLPVCESACPHQWVTRNAVAPAWHHNSNDVIPQLSSNDLLLLFLLPFPLWRSGLSLLPTLSLNLPLTNPCCHGNEIWNKIGHNSASTGDISKTFASNKRFLEMGYWIKQI